jgi:hypothetical protein
MKKLIIGIAIFLLSVIVSKLSAQNCYRPTLCQQQHIEQTRIYNGIRNGQLTKHEAERLEYEQAKIHHDIKMAKADGVVTPHERAHIRCEEAKASRDIFRQKHDFQNRQ